MQVYVAVHDDVFNYLIVRKRFRNQWWNGRRGRTAVVNQAGQWALPGGKQEEGESAIATALREFEEETGVNLTAQGVTGGRELITNDYYKVVDFDVSKAQLQDLQLATNANVQASGADAERPAGALVTDWELQGTCIFPSKDLPNYLGKHQALPADVEAEVQQQPPHRHAIDWYEAIAQKLVGR